MNSLLPESNKTDIMAMPKEACIYHNATLSRDKTQQQSIPLLSPGEFVRFRNGHYRFILSLLRQVVPRSDNDINITPPDRQINSWTSNGIPIGATGMWYEFGNVPEVWRMLGLTGCTAIFIICRRGFWACHLWESTKPRKLNGGSAFLERHSAEVTAERRNSEFQRIAVDILMQQTPKDQEANRGYTSLADLKTRFGDPFRNGSEVEIFILTKAKSANDSRQKYASKVTLLRAGLEAAIPGSTYREQTYIGDLSSIDVPADANGIISVQYTPYNHDAAGIAGETTQCAVARVWAELHEQPVIEKQWEPLVKQRLRTQM